MVESAVVPPSNRTDPKMPTLWSDVLIALSARQIGATLVTRNVADFELLRRYVRFELEGQPGSAS